MSFIFLFSGKISRFSCLVLQILRPRGHMITCFVCRSFKEVAMNRLDMRHLPIIYVVYVLLYN